MTGRLSVFVLTCGRIGVDVAARLAGLAEVRSLTVVTTRAARRRQSALEKARAALRFDGPEGVLRAAAARLRHGAGAHGAGAHGAGTHGAEGGRLADEIRARCPGAAHLHFDDLHAPGAREQLQALDPDLGVVAGTYVLGPDLFTIPRLGCINLHLGRAPDFRGSSPGFYEMLEGVPEVGVTIHRVTAALDGGPILAQERFPLELAPAGDPLAYLRRYQQETLIPNGARMIAAVVAGLASGPIPEREQGLGRRPRRRADWQRKRELRRVVRTRRARPRGWLTYRPREP
jgi:formyl transferase-like protein